MSWKTIDTAKPDYNTPILLFNNKARFEGTFVGYRVIANRGLSNEEVLTMDRRKLNFVKATHWQKCPPPPPK